MQRRTVLLIPSDDCGWVELRHALTTMPNLDVKQMDGVMSSEDTLTAAASLQAAVVIAATRIGGESTFPFLGELQQRTSRASRIVLLTTRFSPDELAQSEGIGIVAHLQWRDLHPHTLPHLLNALIFDDIIIASREVMEAFVAARCRVRGARKPPPGFSPRELAILKMLAEGFTEKEIAEAEGTSRRTVERLVGTLELKLDARTQFALAIKAYQLGLLG